MRNKLNLILSSVGTLALLVALLLAPAHVAMAEGLSSFFSPPNVAMPFVSVGGFEVVASNLDNPRSMVFGANGALYIAEAGRGGDGTCIDGAEGTVCYGASGAVTRVLNGKQERVANGLPSLAGQDGTSATGPHDVAFDANGTLHVLIGLGLNPTARDTLGEVGADFGQLVSISESGEATNVVDVAAIEASDNPDRRVVDSNPFGLLPFSDGFVATDAGGNTLLQISSSGTFGRSAMGGMVSVLTVFPTRSVEFPPASGTEISMEAVPTGVVEGPDGAIYVGQLTGFPFPVGGARVYRILPGQEPEIYADGFTNILDIAFDRDGNLYVLEFATNGLLSGDSTGALIRVAPDGSRKTIASQGLTNPSGMTVGPDDMIYIANIARAAGSGQVIRINPNEPTAVSLNSLHAGALQKVAVGTLALLTLTLSTGLLLLWRRQR